MKQKQISQNYKKSYQKFGLNPKSLKWKNKKASEKRFDELISELNFENKTILDVGCGFGDILPFIEKKTQNFSYMGCDILPEFIKEAKKIHPKYEFEVSDFTRDIIKNKYDIILASGSLSSNRQKNLEFRKKIIKKLFNSTNYAFAFNMAGDFPQPNNNKKNNIWYADSAEILKYCLSLTKRVAFRTGYTYRDFTITMYKPLKNPLKIYFKLSLISQTGFSAL